MKCYNIKKRPRFAKRRSFMDILVISDSHGRQNKIEEVIARQIKKPDAVIFLGDGFRDITYADVGDVPIYSVRGNCDAGLFFGSDVPEERSFTLGGKKFFITHGHRYGVKSTLTPLISHAAGIGADVLLYGHTHEGFERVLASENEYGIKLSSPLHIMNPGSIGSYPYYFGVVSIDKEGRILLSHGSLQ